MFIKLVGHFIDNPRHIDKVIVINGLPEEWLLKTSKYGGKELVKPWVPDNPDNIPLNVRNLCDEIEVTMVYPPIEKGKDSVVDKVKIIGLKLDYGTEPGHEMWEKIERYLEQSVPRDQMVPKPALCAPDQKSDFNPHEVRRNTRGGLELRKSEVPVVNLPKKEEPKTPIISVIQQIQKEEVKKEVVKEKSYVCKKCGKEFTGIKVFRGHNLGCKKKVEEPVGV